MSTYTIPVAFVVNASSEDEAAKIIVEQLAPLNGKWFDEQGHNVVDCWWTPNHPDADGNDNGVRLVWEA